MCGREGGERATQVRVPQLWSPYQAGSGWVSKSSELGELCIFTGRAGGSPAVFIYTFQVAQLVLLTGHASLRVSTSSFFLYCFDRSGMLTSFTASQRPLNCSWTYIVTCCTAGHKHMPWFPGVHCSEWGLPLGYCSSAISVDNDWRIEFESWPCLVWPNELGARWQDVMGLINSSPCSH